MVWFACTRCPELVLVSGGVMAGPGVRVPRMAVYYPYIHFRDERWLN